MVRTLFKPVFCVLTALLMFVSCTQDTGTNPYDCSKTKAYFVLKSSDLKHRSDTGITDTIGNSISYGFNSNLFKNIDSVRILKLSSSTPTDSIFLYTFKDISSSKYSDTVWNALLLSDTGKITLTGTAYLSCAKISGTVTVHILSRPPNNRPKLIVPLQIFMHPGATCTLTVAASDPDTFQTLTFSTVKAPAASSFNTQSRIFTWQAPTDFIGMDSVIFKVQDNGYPPASDQKTVYLIVQNPFTTHLPVLTVKGVRNIFPGDSCILKLKAADQDPLRTVTVSMLSGPQGSVLKDSIFTWVAPSAFNGKDSAIFIAKDDGLPPKSDTVKVFITVSNNIPLPSRPDSLKVISRIGGWVTLQWRTSSTTDFYTVFRAGASHAGTFTAIDTVYDTLSMDSVGFLSCKYYVKAFNKSGESPSSDTVPSVYVNLPPQWQKDTINEPAKVGQSLQLTLSDMCSDPNGDPLTYSLINGKPNGDTIQNGVYSFTPTAADTGVFLPRVIAKDPQGLADTLTIHLTVTADDRQPPYIKLFSPTPDSSTVSASSVTVKVVCKDSSGVASVKCSMGTDTFSVSNTDSIYSAAVTGLKSTGVNEILFIATDKSINANRDTLKVHVKYVLPPPNTSTVSYDANGSNTGTAPLDTNHYPSGKKVIVLGNTGTLVRTGYTFAGWNTKNDGSGTSYAPADTFAMGASNVTLYAKWTQKTTFALTITATNGSVTKSPSATAYDSGTVVTLTPVPANGYHFSSWSGDLTGTTNPTTITMNSAKSVTATFAINPPNTFALTVSASNGTVKKTPDLPQYDSGSSVGLKATANTGYHFVNWSGDAAGTTDSTTILMNAARNVTANFVINTYQLTVAAGTGGSITAPATSPTPVSHGIATTITAAPGALYSFTNWTVTAGTATIASATSANTTVTLTSGNATIMANFTALTSSLTMSNDGHGTTTPTGTTTVNQGVATGITASPNGGYVFAGWSVTAGTATIATPSSTSTTVTLTSGNATVQANFTANRPTVTVSPNSYPGVCEGSHIFTATPSGGTSPYTCEWFNSDGSSTSIISTTISCYYAGNYSMYCIVTDNYGMKDTSNTVTATVYAKPTITSQPQSVNACFNQIVSFTTQGSGTGLSYTWYDSHGSIMGTNATLTLVASPAGTYSYYCVVQNSNGCQTSSNTVTLTVKAPLITANPSNASVCGETNGGASMTVSTSGATSFQWYDASGTIIDGKYYSGTQSATLNFLYIPSSWNGTSYHCVVTGSGCTATSSSAQLTVYPAVTINYVTNSSWYNQQGAGGNPNGNFWVEITPPSGTTEHVIITNPYEPGFSQSYTFTALAYPEVCSGFYGPNEPAGSFSVEYWTVDNSTGCSSSHNIWTNPAWGSHH